MRKQHALALIGLGITLLVGCAPTQPTPVDATPVMTPAEAARPAVVEAFQREFGAHVPRPAIYTDSIDCGQFPHYMTVAYLPGGGASRQMLAMYLASDGRTLVAGSEGRMKVSRMVWVPPAGRFSVLTVLVTYDATIGPDTMTHLEAAQRNINAAHAGFAAARGYAEPIVRFDFTNITVAEGTLLSPRSAPAVRTALESRGENPAAFDFLAVININPTMSEGGFAQPGPARPHFTYMGNFSAWQSRISEAKVESIARASYHHEIGHHWGWDHDWTPTCSPTPSFGGFITSPLLFGWEDLDGDGIPEILDATPCARQHSASLHSGESHVIHPGASFRSGARTGRSAADGGL